MHTAIGKRLLASSRELAIASTIGILVVIAGLTLVLWNRYPETIEGRGVLAVLALVALFWLVRGDLT